MGQTRAKGIGLSYIYTFLNMICGLLMSSFLLRQLGDIQYGLYQTVSAFANNLIILEFGVGTVMSRNIAVCRNSSQMNRIRNYTSTLWYITAFLSIAIALAAWGFYLNIGRIYRSTMSDMQIEYAQKLFLFVAANLVISFFIRTLDGILLGYEQYTFTQSIQLFKLMLRTGLIIGFTACFHDAIVVVFIDTVLSVIVFVVTLVYCKCSYDLKFKLKYFDFSILRESLPLCVALLIQSVVNQANGNVDKFLIGIRIGMESVAVYSVSQYIYTVFFSLTSIPIAMYLPQVARDIGRGLEGQELMETLINPCRLSSLVGGLVMCGFFAVGKPFLEIVYGQAYLDAWIYAMVIIVPMFFNMVTGVLINVLDVRKKRLARSYALLFTTFLNIILTIIMMEHMGILGAVIATAVSTILGQIMIMGVYYTKKMGIDVLWLYRRSLSRSLPVFLCASGISHWITCSINNTWAAFLSCGSLFVVISGVGLYFFELTNEEKQACKSIVKSIHVK